MSGANLMAPESYAVLRHIEVNGPRTRPEIAKGLAGLLGDPTKTTANLVGLGYLARDESTKVPTYTLTNKARVKLSSPYVPRSASAKPRKAREARSASAPSSAARQAVAAAERRAKAWTSPHHRPGAMATPYRATEYAPSTRPGAMVAFGLPSRMGDTLRYRDGRVTDMAGQPVND